MVQLVVSLEEASAALPSSPNEGSSLSFISRLVLSRKYEILVLLLPTHGALGGPGSLRAQGARPAPHNAGSRRNRTFA